MATTCDMRDVPAFTPDVATCFPHLEAVWDGVVIRGLVTAPYHAACVPPDAARSGTTSRPNAARWCATSPPVPTARPTRPHPTPPAGAPLPSRPNAARWCTTTCPGPPELAGAPPPVVTPPPPARAPPPVPARRRPMVRHLAYRPDAARSGTTSHPNAGRWGTTSRPARRRPLVLAPALAAGCGPPAPPAPDPPRRLLRTALSACSGPPSPPAPDRPRHLLLTALATSLGPMGRPSPLTRVRLGLLMSNRFPWAFVAADVDQPILSKDFLATDDLLVDPNRQCLRRQSSDSCIHDEPFAQPLPCLGNNTTPPFAAPPALTFPCPFASSPATAVIMWSPDASDSGRGATPSLSFASWRPVSPSSGRNPSTVDFWVELALSPVTPAHRRFRARSGCPVHGVFWCTDILRLLG
ncbi:proline-rich protein 36-like [Scylla paramamosain]|uniref:proline-rich protein 36-like n=1 Tax=Scylla paramamosain TaxID=85552 RepID=UPI0030839864